MRLGILAHAPPVVVRDRVAEYYVEKLLNSRIWRGNLQFLVQWDGYPVEQVTWEPEENVSPIDICNLYRRHPGAPCRIGALHFESLLFQPLWNLTEPSDC